MVSAEGGTPKAERFVNGLGIMVGNERNEFEGDAFVTRGQLAKILSVIYDVNAESYAGDSNFSDVDSSQWFFPYTNTAYEYGYMIGYDDETFRPEQYVKYSEALLCMLRVSGYSEYMAENYGTDDNSIVTVARMAGITKGVGNETSAPVSRTIMSSLIYNTLHTEMMVADKISAGRPEYRVEKGLRVLKERMGIDIIEGRLLGCGIMSMLESGENLANDQVAVGENVYDNKTGNTFYDSIGYYGDFYVKTENVPTEELVYVEFNDSKNDTITIMSEDIDSADMSHISYYEDGTDKKKRISLPSDITVVYNGRLLRSFNDYIFTPEYGKIRIIDDRVVIIYDMQTYLIERFDYTNDMIYDKYTNAGLHLDDSSGSMYMSNTGRTIGNPLYNAAYHSVLDVMKSLDGKSTIAILTDEAFTGKVDSVNTSDGKIVIDGKEYTLAQSFMNVPKSDGSSEKLYETIKAGMSIEFYVNSRDQIAGCDIDFVGGYSYGYLLRAYETEDFETVKFRIYTQAGTKVEYEARNKLTVNPYGVLKSPAAILGAINNGDPQLIRYKIDNDNYITEVQTAYDNRNGEERFVKDKFSLDFKTDLEKKATRIYNYGVGANFALDDSTLVFFIPDDLSNMKKFKAGNKTLLSGDVRDSNIELYDTNEAGAASVVIYYSGGSGGTPPSTLWRSDALIISKTAEIMNEDGEESCRLYGYSAGKEVEIDCGDAEIENYGLGNYWNKAYADLYKGRTLKDLQKGDMILVEKDSDGNISGFLLIFSANEPPSVYKEVMCDGGTPTEENHLAATSTHYGKVIKAYHSAILANAHDDGSDPAWNKTFASGSAGVYLYDTAKDKVTMITADEIREGDTVFIRKWLITTKEIMVIR